jgi:hypothetical protein
VKERLRKVKAKKRKEMNMLNRKPKTKTRILEALKAESYTPAELADHLDIDRKTIHAQLRRLQGKKIKQGMVLWDKETHIYSLVQPKLGESKNHAPIVSTAPQRSEVNLNGYTEEQQRLVDLFEHINKNCDRKWSWEQFARKMRGNEAGVLEIAGMKSLSDPIPWPKRTVAPKPAPRTAMSSFERTHRSSNPHRL